MQVSSLLVSQAPCPVRHCTCTDVWRRARARLCVCVRLASLRARSLCLLLSCSYRWLARVALIGAIRVALRCALCGHAWCACVGGSSATGLRVRSSWSPSLVYRMGARGSCVPCVRVALLRVACLDGAGCVPRECRCVSVKLCAAAWKSVARSCGCCLSPPQSWPGRVVYGRALHRPVGGVGQGLASWPPPLRCTADLRCPHIRVDHLMHTAYVILACIHCLYTRTNRHGGAHP